MGANALCKIAKREFNGTCFRINGAFVRFYDFLKNLQQLFFYKGKNKIEFTGILNALISADLD
jgi:hypothetical protein